MAETLSDRTYGIIMIVIVVVMLGMTAANAYVMIQRDECTETVRMRLDSAKARLDAAKGEIQKK